MLNVFRPIQKKNVPAWANTRNRNKPAEKLNRVFENDNEAKFAHNKISHILDLKTSMMNTVNDYKNIRLIDESRNPSDRIFLERLNGTRLGWESNSFFFK